MCMMEGVKPVTQHMCAGRGLKGLRAQQMQIVTRQLEDCDGNYTDQQDLTLGWCFDHGYTSWMYHS